MDGSIMVDVAEEQGLLARTHDCMMQVEEVEEFVFRVMQDHDVPLALLDFNHGLREVVGVSICTRSHVTLNGHQDFHACLQRKLQRKLCYKENFTFVV